MKRSLLVFFGILCACTILGISIWTSIRVQPTPIPHEEPMRIGLVIYPGFGTFYIAEEKRFFEKAGVDVELVELDINSMIPALESGQVDLLIGSSDLMPIVGDAGVDAKQIFSTDISYGADGLLVTDDVHSLNDLKGKMVYLPFGFPSHFFFRVLQEESGMPFEDVTLVNTNPDEIGASFVAGKIEAGMTWEPWLSHVAERPGGTVLISSKERPGLITDIVMAPNEVIANRREDVKRVMRGFFDAVDWWNTHPEEGNAIVAKNFGMSIETFAPMRETIELSTLEANLHMFDPSMPYNVFDLANRAATIYAKDGVITTTPNADALTDASLLKELSP